MEGVIVIQLDTRNKEPHYSVNFSNPTRKKLDELEIQDLSRKIFFYSAYQLDGHWVLTEQQNWSDKHRNRGIEHDIEMADSRLKDFAEQYARRLSKELERQTDIEFTIKHRTYP